MPGLQAATYSGRHLIFATAIYVALQAALAIAFGDDFDRTLVLIAAQTVAAVMLLVLAWKPLRKSADGRASVADLAAVPKQSVPISIAGLLAMFAATIGLPRGSLAANPAWLDAVSSVGWYRGTTNADRRRRDSNLCDPGSQAGQVERCAGLPAGAGSHAHFRRAAVEEGNPELKLPLIIRDNAVDDEVRNVFLIRLGILRVAVRDLRPQLGCMLENGTALRGHLQHVVGHNAACGVDLPVLIRTSVHARERQYVLHSRRDRDTCLTDVHGNRTLVVVFVPGGAIPE